MISRWLKDGGIEPLAGYIIIALIFSGFSVYLFYTTEFAVYIYAGAALALVAKLSETKRVEFLSLCFGYRKLKKIRIAENLICTAPFIVFLLCRLMFPAALLLSVLAAALALVHFRTRLHFIIPTPFSKNPFEFSIGFRNNFYLVITAYALATIAVCVGNFNLGVFSLLLVFAATLSYYTQLENEYYIWIHSQSARAFLLRKIKTAIIFSCALALPIALALLIFFPGHIVTVLIFFLIGWAFLLFMLLGKYAAYPGQPNITQFILLVVCVGFPPLLIVLIPYLFKKSEYRLRSILP